MFRTVLEIAINEIRAKLAQMGEQPDVCFIAYVLILPCNAFLLLDILVHRGWGGHAACPRGWGGSSPYF